MRQQSICLVRVPSIEDDEEVSSTERFLCVEQERVNGDVRVATGSLCNRLAPMLCLVEGGEWRVEECTYCTNQNSVN